MVAGLCTALIVAAIGACVYNSDTPCGSAMHFVAEANACVCDSTAIPMAGGCKPCASDEVASGGKCVCPEGQTKNANNTCARITGLGDACDTMAAPCTDSVYSYCATEGSATSGTCTSACASNDECAAAYTCTTWEAKPYCRTYSGVDSPCSGAADCTGDAAFCESYQTHSCLVSGCNLAKNDCPRGKTCTDMSRFSLPNLCVGKP